MSENKPEVRFGPTTNIDEGWCQLGSRKLSPNNRVTVFNADKELLNVTFSDTRFANWTYARYHHRDLQDLSKFFAGFLRHYGCTHKGGLSCDSGAWFPCADVDTMLTPDPTRRRRQCTRATNFWNVQHGDGCPGVFVLLALHTRKIK